MSEDVRLKLSGLATQILRAGQEARSMGEQANFTPVLKLITQHQTLSAQHNIAEEFGDLKAQLESLQARLETYRNTGFFQLNTEVTPSNEPRH